MNTCLPSHLVSFIFFFSIAARLKGSRVKRTIGILGSSISQAGSEVVTKCVAKISINASGEVRVNVAQ